MVRLQNIISEGVLQPTQTRVLVFGTTTFGPGTGNYITIVTTLHSVKSAQIELIRGAGGPFPVTGYYLGFATAGSNLEIDGGNLTLQVGTATVGYFAVGDAGP